IHGLSTAVSLPDSAAVWTLGAPPIAAYVGSFMDSVAAIVPPTDFVYASDTPASFGVHTLCALRVPTLVANEVTSSPFTACTKSMTPFHSFRVSTPLNPAGAVSGELSEFVK